MAFLIPLAATPMGAAIIGGTVGLLSKTVFDWFRSPPTQPPQTPPTEEMTQQKMIREAQQNLGMEVENHYNFAVCGNSGTGMSDSECKHSTSTHEHLTVVF